MLRFLNRCSRGRGAWLLLAFTALALELTALYFQHVMLLKPCVLCIYQRCALWGVFAAGIVGAIAPSTALRYPPSRYGYTVLTKAFGWHGNTRIFC